jgi:acetoin:2,6-dichlorophenolindophenol oxidoreductase subunit alpha
MQPDLWSLYKQMLRSRLFEEVVAMLWREGLISGEMHLGTGEEAAIAGVVDHLRDGDAMALDHRGTAALLMRGVDPNLLLREFLGRSDGLCSGMGGHMHLFAPELLAASSGIVGASGPAAAGFAIAGVSLRPGSLAISFAGEGAMNQGMMMEAMNLAVAWKLPVLFVCKDNTLAIATPSQAVTGASLVERARGFGMPACEVDGSDVEAVWLAAHEAVERARFGGGPTFLNVHCVHLEGHFLGDALLRMRRRPLKEMRPRAGELIRAVTRRKGAPLRQRLAGLESILSLIARQDDKLLEQGDPVPKTRLRLVRDPARLEALERIVFEEIREALKAALLPVDGSSESSPAIELQEIIEKKEEVAQPVD